jgi:hypothetical protein
MQSWQVDYIAYESKAAAQSATLFALSMKKLICRWLVTSVGLLAAAGCGTPGVPQPPSLHLPKPVEDLRASRKGDKVILQWTVPTNTTDDQAIARHMGKTLVCRNFSAGECHDVAGEIPADKVAAGKPAEQQDSIAAAIRSNPGKDFVNYTVETLNNSGKSAGPSNTITVFLAPSMPAVQDLRAELHPEAIILHWALPALESALRTRNTVQVLRSDNSAPARATPTILAELPAQAGPAEFADRSFAWEKSYSYRVIGISHVLTQDGRELSQFESEETAPVTITAHDVFPPAAPSGLQAVFSSTIPGYIDLTWTPNAESDLAGYNVYRATYGGSFAKMNPELVKTPTFRDSRVAPGQFTYRVSAVDARGNESAQSQPTTETVPAQ